eukprot:TRINITY_DN19919_c0_g1_i1.p1 TRINITY_DN19919_c0_g1~~TRINITY_DN19919_c0_g1_i1.p1  ORF type:complete len:298 (+),score=33.80 TRINITY_DN19919_c0_g1_i1:56-895(+)
MLSYIKNWNSSSTWWHWTYFVDWFLPIIVTLIVWLPFKYSSPYCGRRLSESDQSIQFKYSTSPAFPTWTLPLVGGVVPATLCVLFVVLNRYKNSGNLPQGYSLRHDVHNIILATLQACLLAICLTDPLKNYAGRLRPDYADRLQRAGLAISAFEEICASTKEEVMDGRRSFPSGHSSISFAGWTIVALLVFTRIPVRSRGADVFWRLCVLVPTLMFPAVVAISRTRDNRHNFSDVLAGSCIGVFAGAIVFSLHFYFDSRLPVNRKTDDLETDEPTALSA